MFEPRPMDRGKQLVVERSQIDALHFGAERRASRSNAQTIRAAGCDTVVWGLSVIGAVSNRSAEAQRSRSDRSHSEEIAPTSSSAAEMKSGSS